VVVDRRIQVLLQNSCNGKIPPSEDDIPHLLYLLDHALLLEGDSGAAPIHHDPHHLPVGGE